MSQTYIIEEIRKKLGKQIMPSFGMWSSCLRSLRIRPACWERANARKERILCMESEGQCEQRQFYPTD